MVGDFYGHELLGLRLSFLECAAIGKLSEYLLKLLFFFSHLK